MIRSPNHMQTNSYLHNLVYTNVLSTNATHISAYTSGPSSSVSSVESFNIKEKKSMQIIKSKLRRLCSLMRRIVWKDLRLGLC